MIDTLTDEHLLKQIFEQSFNSILITDANLDQPGPNILYVNPAFSRVTGYSLEDLKGKTPRIFQGEKTKRKTLDALKKACKKGEFFSAEAVNYKKDGSSYYVKWNISPIKNTNGEITNYVSIQEDITEAVETTKYLQKFIDLQSNIVILTDGTNIQYANKKFFGYFGFENLDTFKKSNNCICEKFIEDEKFFSLKDVKENENWIQIIQALPQSQRLIGLLNNNFEIDAFSVSISNFEDNLYIITFTDISQTVLNQMELSDKVIHDKLTNAFNREYFEQNYKRLINNYTKNNYNLALSILDIDYFKKINDNYGHDKGDYVLKNLVELINHSTREDDILIRWGGEEFIILLKVSSIEGVTKALNHIRKTIEEYAFQTVGKITVSFGASLYKKDEEIEKTIKRADEALYTAKSNGRNQVIVI